MDAHVWRQTQTQSNINNFYEEDMNILNPRKNERENGDGIFRMEFPLMQWLVAAQYKVFGPHLIITRIFMFLLGIFAVLGMYSMLSALFKNPTLAAFGAWAFNFSPSFYYYTINPLPDLMSLAFGLWGLALFFRWRNNENRLLLFLSGVCLYIATLCKLPFIIFYAVPFAFFLQSIKRKNALKPAITNAFIVFSLAILPIAWYLWVIPQWQGNMVVHGIFDNQEGANKLLDYIVGNLVSTLPELLLNYGAVPLFIAGSYFAIHRRVWQKPHFIPIALLTALAVAYYLFEANAIALHHDYYLFPFYPILFIIVGYGAYQLFNARPIFLRGASIFFMLVLPITCYIRMHKKWNPESPGFNKDLLTYKTELRNVVPQDALVVVGNDVSHYIFLYYVNRKGWAFDNDYLTDEMLAMTISKGATYLFTDSERVANHVDLQPFFKERIAVIGSIQVVKLQAPNN